MMRHTSLGLALLGMMFGCAEEEQTAEPIIRSVRYVMAESAGGASERTFSGQVQASELARLSFQVAGRVQSVEVDLGDRVKSGQVIASLDPTDFRLQLEEARASLGQARAQARSAEATYTRTRALYENKNASVQDLDNARAQKDSSLSLVSAASQSVRRLQRQLEYATLTARSDGVIQQVDVEPNEVVNAGQPVAVLQAGEQLEVSLSVPETYVNRIERGMSVRVGVSSAESTLTGTVSELATGTTGGAFPVRVRLPKDATKIEAGMAADVTFEFKADEERKGVYRVPTTAVGEDRTGRFVFVVSELNEASREGQVKRVSVTTGGIETDGIDVLSGLS
ncbi:MAG: efflux RND transporter periplasmic adaptor subunit, partial [Myxococcota bacterium]